MADKTTALLPAITLAVLGLVVSILVWPLGRESRARLTPATPSLAPATLTLPGELGSVRFAVMGDVGRGDRLQYETAAELGRWRERFDFEFVLLLGDNIYGPGTAEDLALRFDRPYAALLERGVTFHAVVGNHDPPSILTHPGLGMEGRRYYSFVKTAGPPWNRTDVAFFAIDSVNLDSTELRWLRRALSESRAGWRIAFYHQPLYTSGQYRWRALRQRRVLESIFVEGGIDVGFSGHEHFYERIVPQQGVQYFTSGAGGALRIGDIRPSSVLAAGYDDDTHFMLIEVTPEALHFQAVTRTGHTVDSGTLPREPEKRAPPVLRR